MEECISYWKYMIRDYLSLVKYYVNKISWRMKNRHNSTWIESFFPLEVVKVGRYTYGPLYIISGGKQNKVIIGDFCSISPGVKFIIQADHPTNFISTFPFKVRLFNENEEAISKGDIQIEDDVWIGANSIILSGVKIGKGAVIGAGSVVCKNIEPYSIVAGVPAKEIKKRFSEDIIKELNKINYKKISFSDIEKKINLLYEDITNDNYKEIIDKIIN